MIALWRRANARNVSFVTLYGGQLMLSTRSITPNYPVILSHRTTVSLETYPLLLYKWTLFVSWRSRWRLMPSFAFYSFTYMTTDGVKGLFLTQKRFVRHHFYWLRKWQSRSVFVRMVTLQRFFALLIKKGLNYCAITMIIQFFAYKERHKGSQRIQFTVTSLNLETRCGEHVDEFNLLLNSPPYPNVPT